MLNGWTPLLYATFNAQIKIIEYLINNEVDVNKHKGIYFEFSVIYYRLFEIKFFRHFILFLNNIILDGYTPLMALCNSTKETTEQRIKCLTVLIEAGANPNASNKLRYFLI